MKQFIKITTILGLSAFIISCQLFADKKKADFAGFPEIDMVGIPPDKSVKNWVKFDLIGTMEHPFPFVWFSPQEFETKYPNELIKLEEDGYEQFKTLVRANECETNFKNVHGDPVLRVTEYADDQQTVRCIMPPTKTCDYLTKMFALPKITWTEKQIDIIGRMAGEFRCALKQENQKIYFEFFFNPARER